MNRQYDNSNKSPYSEIVLFVEWETASGNIKQQVFKHASYF